VTRTTLAALAGALAASLAACSEPTNLAPTQLNLDRPVDIAFACYGSLKVADGSVIQSAQPTFSCDQRSRDPATVTDMAGNPLPLEPEGQVGAGETTWYGFILQSAPGTVAVAEWATGPSKSFASGSVLVLDADKFTPGKNSISVGEEPIAIATDRTGCFEVTANAGSCDLSELDINSAVANAAITAHPEGPVKVSRLAVTNTMGNPILAKPAAMLSEPSSTTVGPQCGPTPEGLVYIAYPSCDLVAAVDTATGRMVKGIKLSKTGLPTITEGDQSCPAECTNPGMPGAPLGGGTGDVRPVSLSLVVDDDPEQNTVRRRLAIGSEKSATLIVIDLDTGFLPTGAPLPIALDNPSGNLGVTSLAISGNYAMGGDSQGQLDEDVAPAGRGQYVYAVATDGTVRVADVLDQRRECDTQIDSRFLRTFTTPADLETLQCLPLDPTSRRAGAKGPGIELIGDGVPLSVAFFSVPRVIDRPKATLTGTMNTVDLDDTRGTLVGNFAVVTATSGASFIVNVDDDNAWDRNASMADQFDPREPLGTQPSLIIAHQLRDVVRYRGATETPSPGIDDRGKFSPACSDLGPPPEALFGGPRITSPPTRNLGSLSPVATNKAEELPGLRNVACIDRPPADGTPAAKVPVSELQFSAPVDVRDAAFPDIRGIHLDETWTVTWEGALSLDTQIVAVDGPPFRSGQTKIDGTGLHLVDPNRPFCEAGVEQYDIVQLRGCNPSSGNLDCPSGYECFLHPESQLGMGACMATNEADRLANLCRDFLISGRRYTVAPSPSANDLVLLPRKHELRTTPLDGCIDDNQCTLLANYAAQVKSDRDPIASPIVQPTIDPNDGKLKDVNGNQWSCQADPLRAPINADPARNRRCVQTCTTNADCNVADDELNRRFSVNQFKMVCQTGVCMESILPPQQCINGPQRYDLHAGEAFAVVGTKTGYVHPNIAGAGGKCVADPTANVLLRGRIPLKVPACDLAADPITGKLPSGAFDANPCALPTTTSEAMPTFAPAPTGCTVTPGEVIERAASGIRFRNPSMTFTLVDPVYPGDSQCALDRGGPFANIPLVYQGYQIGFHQTNGFAPLTLSQIGPAFPVKVVRGPTESIWILDDGDFLSTNITQASTRGKVFRLESTNLGTVSLLQ
jgi:hypothetical protein